MKYLLDVNVLLALGVDHHEFHPRASNWVGKLRVAGVPEFTTCATTELGFVRVLAQTQQYGFTVAQAAFLLSRLKATEAVKFTFVADNHGVSDLPPWVKSAKQITDGHLAGLAKSHGAMLATLDERIPGAFVIPGKR